jgi:GNAT superfamily N-acetyltransferase
MIRIERLAVLPPDLPALAALAQAEGFGMLGVLIAEWAAGTHRFTAPGEALCAARDKGGRLLGLGGITRDPYAPALRMRRFYVRPDARRDGVARALVSAVLEEARVAGAGLVRLRAPPAADAFWERCGFLPVQDATATHQMRVDPLR